VARLIERAAPFLARYAFLYRTDPRSAQAIRLSAVLLPLWRHHCAALPLLFLPLPLSQGPGQAAPTSSMTAAVGNCRAVMAPSSSRAVALLIRTVTRSPARDRYPGTLARFGAAPIAILLPPGIG